jgi:hypothetical protein
MACSGVGKYSASPQYQHVSNIRGALTTPIKWDLVFGDVAVAAPVVAGVVLCFFVFFLWRSGLQ